MASFYYRVGPGQLFASSRSESHDSGRAFCSFADDEDEAVIMDACIGFDPGWRMDDQWLRQLLAT